MQVVKKTLVAGGLVLVTGPFCFIAHAQDYVDVEAERAAAKREQQQSTPPPAGNPAPVYSSPAPAQDPYSVQPAQSYPATSYGTNNAPAASSGLGAAPVASSSNQNANLLFQVQQLQQEVMRLNGMVEEQAHELRRLKEQSLERYVDLDKRVSAMGAAGGGAIVAGNSGGAVAAGGASSSGGPAQAGEAEAYRSAYGLVRGQQFDQAVSAFQKFLVDYPGGKYAANAHYWLGELYLVIEPQNLEASRQSFMLLLTEYPDNSKVPDALYKLGKVHYLKGNSAKGKEFLDRVIREHPNSSAARLAKDFLAENY